MSLKIYSWNVNGIRASAKAGFFEWLKKSDADMVFLQETRALPEQLAQEQLEPYGYKSFWHPADKKGYSGVAVYTRLPIQEKDLVVGLGNIDLDREGRFIGLFYNNIFCSAAYFPNSQPEGKRLEYKLAFCQAVHKKLNDFRKENIPIILGGDINIAHTEIDLANPQQNRKNPGFLPEERLWLTKFLDDGYLDAFRLFEKRGGFYTWWSNRPGVRQRNIGWRIDAHFISEEIKNKIYASSIHADVMGSDHCPISLDIS
ncbi:exodeoxyribonuclease III [Silvanigrella aquatica]|uniref:Exodeoxyribonuclease III n=1 Tax=Silvanigrella aquatica TaxID=1915309 RepID=A0A1L4CZI5_9BACT|nr:exodeoxyribonuclease III [Silvanigrella aquatica]APJ03362.1 exodeoxyribonuclease III [Silvanigrella aquatica]